MIHQYSAGYAKERFYIKAEDGRQDLLSRELSRVKRQFDLSDEEIPKNKVDSNKEAIADEWTSDIEELEKEIATQA